MKMIKVDHRDDARKRFREDLHFIKYEQFHVALANASTTTYFLGQMADTERSYFMCLIRCNAALLESSCGDFKLCHSTLSAMSFLLKNHYDSLFPDDASHLRRLECLNRLINFLGTITRISWRDVQNKEYKKTFENILPEILDGYDEIWIHVFEFFYSAEAEYLIVCESCFEVLSRLAGYRMKDKYETEESQRNNLNSRHGEMSGIDIEFCLKLISSVLTSTLHNGEAASWGAIVVQQFITSFSHGQHRELTMKASESLYSAIQYHHHDKFLVNCILNQLSYDIVKFGIPDLEPVSACEILVEALKIHLDDEKICGQIIRIFDTWSDDSDDINNDIGYNDDDNGNNSGIHNYDDDINNNNNNNDNSSNNINYNRNNNHTNKNKYDKNHNGNQSKLINAGADVVMIMILKHWKYGSALTYSACQFILFLISKNQSYKIKLGNLGICEVIMDALLHGNNKQLKIFRSVFYSLAHNCIENKRKLLLLGAGDFVPKLNLSERIYENSVNRENG